MTVARHNKQMDTTAKTAKITGRFHNLALLASLAVAFLQLGSLV